MQRLGYTRSANRSDHLLLTPDTFVRAPLPGMQKCTAIVHAGPAVGAQFVQYTAEFEGGGCLGPTAAQRFVFVMEGVLSVGPTPLAANGYAYVPEGNDARVTAKGVARAAVIEKSYEALADISAPAMFTGDEGSVSSQPLLGDDAVQVRCLLPADFAFDFAVNTMTYEPGASLPMVEAHIMEHGLVMLAGGGIYRLGENWYPTAAGDFIWMAPYCPQWFGALGKTPAKYLIYKDWNRHSLGDQWK